MELRRNIVARVQKNSEDADLQDVERAYVNNIFGNKPEVRLCFDPPPHA
jgi:hypothetical protein